LGVAGGRRRVGGGRDRGGELGEGLGRDKKSRQALGEQGRVRCEGLATEAASPVASASQPPPAEAQVANPVVVPAPPQCGVGRAQAVQEVGIERHDSAIERDVPHVGEDQDGAARKLAAPTTLAVTGRPAYSNRMVDMSSKADIGRDERRETSCLKLSTLMFWGAAPSALVAAVSTPPATAMSALENLSVSPLRPTTLSPSTCAHGRGVED
jgi:hypothetical protein